MAKLGPPNFQRIKTGSKIVVLLIGYAQNNVAYRFILKDGSGLVALKSLEMHNFLSIFFPNEISVCLLHLH